MAKKKITVDATSAKQEAAWADVVERFTGARPTIVPTRGNSRLWNDAQHGGFMRWAQGAEKVPAWITLNEIVLAADAIVAEATANGNFLGD